MAAYAGVNLAEVGTGQRRNSSSHQIIGSSEVALSMKSRHASAHLSRSVSVSYFSFSLYRCTVLIYSPHLLYSPRLKK